VRTSILVAATLAWAACGESAPKPEGTEHPDPPVPTELRVDWRQAGAGEAFSLAVGDFDGDGTADLVAGGRRVRFVRPDAIEPAWEADWIPSLEDSVLANGENDWASTLAAVPGKDGHDDVLACNSKGAAYLFDGATGETRWHVSLDMDFPFCESVALFGPEDAPLFFPRYGASAWSPVTGEKAWTAELPRGPFFVEAARRAGEAPGLVAITEGVNDDVKPASGIFAATEKFPPAIHAYTAGGNLAWRVTLDQNDHPAVAAVADLDGSGDETPVVGLFEGEMRAFDVAGELRWEKSFPLFGQDPARTAYQALLAKDVDGDGKSEIFAVILDGRFIQSGTGPGLVLALSADGEELWRQPFTRNVEHASLGRLDGEDVLLLGVGPRDRVTAGEALAIRLGTDAAPRIAVKAATPHAVYSVAVIPGDAGDRVAIGSLDPLLRVVDGNGRPAWNHLLTGWLRAMATVPAPGGDWVATGDEFANLSAVDAAGTVRWIRRMESQITGETTAMTSGVLVDGDEPDVVAGAAVLDARGVGLVEVLSLDGTRRASAFRPGWPVAMEVVRDADVPTLLAIEAPGPGESDCRLVAFDGADLFERWSVALAPCIRGEFAIGDVDGDGVAEYAMRVEPPAGDSSFVILVGHGGELLDFHQESLERSLWVRVVPGGILTGGAAIGSQGFVAFRPIGDSGREGWRVLLDATPDESNPIGSPIPGNVVAAALVSDRDGDGVDEIAVSTAANDLVLLDGATGARRWTLNLEPTSIPFPEKHIGGPVAFLPGAGKVPPALIVTQASENRARSRIFAASLDGELLGSVPISAEAFAIGVAERADGTPSAVVAAGLSMYSVRTHPVEP